MNIAQQMFEINPEKAPKLVHRSTHDQPEFNLRYAQFPESGTKEFQKEGESNGGEISEIPSELIDAEYDILAELNSADQNLIDLALLLQHGVSVENAEQTQENSFITAAPLPGLEKTSETFVLDTNLHQTLLNPGESEGSYVGSSPLALTKEIPDAKLALVSTTNAIQHSDNHSQKIPALLEDGAFENAPGFLRPTAVKVNAETSAINLKDIPISSLETQHIATLNSAPPLTLSAPSQNPVSDVESNLTPADASFSKISFAETSDAIFEKTAIDKDALAKLDLRDWGKSLIGNLSAAEMPKLFMDTQLIYTASNVTALERPVGMNAHTVILNSLPPQTHPALQQVTETLVKAHMTQKGITVRLDPPELGNVSIQFQMDSERNVTAIVRAELAETSVVLRDRSELLIQALKENGFENVNLNFEQGSLDFGTGHSFSQQEDEHRSGFEDNQAVGRILEITAPTRQSVYSGGSSVDMKL